MLRTLPSLALLCAALLTGCSGKGVATCNLSTDCESGQICVSGICSDSGLSDGGNQAQPHALGSPCAARADCSTPLGCLTNAVGFANGYCSESCASTSCPSGSVCTDLTSTVAAAKACLYACGGDVDCRPGYVCCAAFGNSCAPSAFCPALSGTSSPTLGASCGSSSSCSAGETCETSSDFPGGFCSRSCTLGDASTCPNNGLCTSTSAGPLCLPGCVNNGSCRSGYTCATSGSSGTKVCQPANNGSDAGTSDAGNSDAGGSDAGNSDAGSSDAGSDGGTDGGPIVFKTCTPPSTSSTWHLVNGGTAGPSSDPGTCQKPVVAAQLTSGNVQHLGINQVGTTVHFNVPAGTGTISIISQATSGVVDTLTFSQGGQSQTVPNGLVPSMLKTPDGTVYFDDTVAAPADLTTAHADPYPSFAYPQSDTSAMTLPNTSQALTDSASGYPAGSWSFLVNDWAYECSLGQVSAGSTCTGGVNTGHYDISVVTKPLAPTTGTIDIGIYIAQANYTAAQGMTDSHLQRFLKQLAVIYGHAGICLGTITLYDLPAWAKNKYAGGVDADKTGPCDNLDQMFSLSQPGNALNFFFVDSIQQNGSNPSGGSIVGIDGAIPGPSGFGGTIHTGAVVNASDLGAGTCGASVSYTGCGDDQVAYIAAHEGGHWMGLYHTTEQVGGLYDPLSDTPQCQCATACVGSTAAAKCCNVNTGANCSDPTMTVVKGVNCTKGTAQCGGGDHMMFWLLDTTSTAVISPEQAKVMRANQIVQ